MAAELIIVLRNTSPRHTRLDPCRAVLKASRYSFRGNKSTFQIPEDFRFGGSISVRRIDLKWTVAHSLTATDMGFGWTPYEPFEMKRSSWEDGLEAIFLPVSIMSLMMMSVGLEFTRAFFGETKEWLAHFQTVLLGDVRWA